MEFLKDLQSCFKNLIATEDEIFSDYTVVAENKTFPCHRLVLAACSQFFRGLFRSDMQEKDRHSLVLKDISYETFKLIYKLIYFNDNELKEENILDVWTAAHFLQMDFIVSTCRKFVMDTINERNCHRYFKHAKLLDENFAAKILEHITCNFDQFKDSQCILELEGEELLSIVRDSNLNTRCEDYVVDTVLKWINHTTNDTFSETVNKTSLSYNLRTDYFVPLLSVSRVTSLNYYYLVELIGHELIEKYRKALYIIGNAGMYQRGYQFDQWPVYASNRKCSQLDDAVLMPSRSKFISVFSLRDKRLIGKLDLSVLPYGAAVNVDEGIYYASGYTDNNKSSLAMFKLLNGVWQKFTNLELSDNTNPHGYEFQAEQQNLSSIFIDSQAFFVNISSGTIYTGRFLNSESLKQMAFVPSGICIYHVTSYEFYFLLICGSPNGSANLNIYNSLSEKWQDSVSIDGIRVHGITSFYKGRKLNFLTSLGEIYVLKKAEFGGFTLRHVTTISNFNCSLIGAQAYCEDLFLFVREKAIAMDIVIPDMFNRVHVIVPQYPCTSLLPTYLFPYYRDFIIP